MSTERSSYGFRDRLRRAASVRDAVAPTLAPPGRCGSDKQPVEALGRRPFRSSDGCAARRSQPGGSNSAGRRRCATQGVESPVNLWRGSLRYWCYSSCLRRSCSSPARRAAWLRGPSSLAQRRSSAAAVQGGLESPTSRTSGGGSIAVRRMRSGCSTVDGASLAEPESSSGTARAPCSASRSVSSSSPAAQGVVVERRSRDLPYVPVLFPRPRAERLHVGPSQRHGHERMVPP
jgi:hypothetical protein